MAVDMNMNVLVVDDYQTMLRILRNLLRQLKSEAVVPTAVDRDVVERRLPGLPVPPAVVRAGDVEDQRARGTRGSQNTRDGHRVRVLEARPIRGEEPARRIDCPHERVCDVLAAPVMR